MKYRTNYLNDVNNARNCRNALSPTKDYVRDNLFQLSDRETWESFQNRLKITPNPPDTRIAFNRLMHSIRARVGDVYRKSTLDQYVNACNGVDGGVDGKGSTMVSFISNKVLRELLTTRMVGVFVERAGKPKTRADVVKPPKVKIIPIEAIVNYVEDSEGNLIKLLLRTNVPTYEDGYIVGEESGFDEYELNNGVVTQSRQSASGSQIGSATSIPFSQIPFAIVEIDESPVYTALEAHNALLQLSSSDYLFLNRSNYPIYTEQYNLSNQMQELQKQQFEQRERIPDSEGKNRPARNTDREAGTETGIKYPMGAERPGFIAPPTEHLNASETKQERLRVQIEEIMSVDALRISDKQQSSDSKREEKEPLVGNIQILFDLLETLERKIASVYHEYYKITDYVVEYPKTFDLRTETTRLANARIKLDLRDDISSLALKRLLTIEAVRDIMPTLSPDKMKSIEAEIMKGKVHLSVTKVVNLLDKGGIGIAEVCSAIGLTEKDAERIREDIEDKLRVIQGMQGAANTPGNGGQPNKPIVEGTPDES